MPLCLETGKIFMIKVVTVAGEGGIVCFTYGGRKKESP